MDEACCSECGANWEIDGISLKICCICLASFCPECINIVLNWREQTDFLYCDKCYEENNDNKDV